MNNFIWQTQLEYLPKNEQLEPENNDCQGLKIPSFFDAVHGVQVGRNSGAKNPIVVQVP